MQLFVQNCLDPSRATEIFSVPKRPIFALPKIVRYRNKSGLQYSNVQKLKTKKQKKKNAIISSHFKRRKKKKAVSVLKMMTTRGMAQPPPLPQVSVHSLLVTEASATNGDRQSSSQALWLFWRQIKAGKRRKLYEGSLAVTVDGSILPGRLARNEGKSVSHN